MGISGDIVYTWFEIHYHFFEKFKPQFYMTHITAVSTIFLQGTTVYDTNIKLEFSHDFVRGAYFNDDNIPNGAGIEAITQCFMLGLNSCIRLNEEQNGIDKTEQLDHIIADLKRALETPMEPTRKN
jgi:hypothetical protein